MIVLYFAFQAKFLLMGHVIYVMQLRSGEDPELWNTPKNASCRGGWAAN